jgi:two-component system phosphate regulon sensor histidine kinase PhoR
VIEVLGAVIVVLALVLGWHHWQLTRLKRWLSQPALQEVPEGRGKWEAVFSTLHRYKRDALRREQQLSDALARFRHAAQALPDGVVILDAEDRIEWANDRSAALLGIDPRADVGQPVANLVRAPAFVEILAAHLSDEIQIEGVQGMMLALQLIPYGQAQTLLLCRDITQTQRVETMRRDFVANVSHELRTPLTVLVGFLETIRELKLDPQRTRDYLGMMREQATRMHRIIEDLLTLSVLESAPPPAADRVRVAPLLARLRSDAEALSGGKHAIALQGTPTRDLTGSEAELSSAFGNLVSNAIRYTPSGGKVELVWREGADGVAFAVEDRPGHRRGTHPAVTERFYRIDRSRSRETGGTGLGLAIVKHAVARHQATLDIDSKPGAGSRFTVRFPASRTLPASTDVAEHPR